MAVSYPIPPWLNQQPDTASAFLNGYRASAQIAQEQQRLAQEKEQAQMQMALKEKELKASTAHDQALLYVTRAYHEQQINLRNATLEQTKQRVDAQTRAAAQKFQAQQQYQKRLQDLMGTGMTEEDAAKTAMLELGPQMGATSSAMASLAKGPGNAAWIPENVQTKEPGHWVTPEGHIIHPAVPRPQNPALPPASRVMALRQEEKELSADPQVKMLKVPTGADQAFKDERGDKLKRLKTIRSELDKYLLPESMKGGFVKMRDPKGRIVKVPAEQQQEQESKGYTLAE